MCSSLCGRVTGSLIRSCKTSRQAQIATVTKASLHAQLAVVSEHLGNQTNNYAEYTGLIRGLQAALACGVKSIRIRGDSKLVVMQVHLDRLCASYVGNHGLSVGWAYCIFLKPLRLLSLSGRPATSLLRFLDRGTFADERCMAGAQRWPGTAPQAGLSTEGAL